MRLSKISDLPGFTDRLDYWRFSSTISSSNKMSSVEAVSIVSPMSRPVLVLRSEVRAIPLTNTFVGSPGDDRVRVDDSDVKPLEPPTFNLAMKPMQRGIVSVDPVVSEVFLTQLEMLLADRPVSIESTPLCGALHCTPEVTRRGLAFNRPVPLASLPPIMSEARQSERFRTCS